MANTIRLEGLDSVRELIAGLGPGLNRANERAQNTMAYELMMAEKAEMRSDIDRPTQFSLGSVLYKKHGASQLKYPGGFSLALPDIKGAGVFLANRITNAVMTDEHYLGVQIAGGQPTLKAMESRLIRNGFMKASQYIVPASSEFLDAYGNLKGSQVSAMFTNMGIGFVGPVQNQKYRFVPGHGSAPPGIYFKKEAKGQFQFIDEWVPYIWFVDRPNYRPRYKWDERADEEINLNFKEILGDAIDYELEKMAK